MKKIIDIINEDFKLKKKGKIGNIYSCHPKDVNELRYILSSRLKEDASANLNDIDVSAITDMSNAFKYLDPRNIDVSQWDVSNVTYMSQMFNGCGNFTGKSIENWDVSNVKDMKSMFSGCNDFNADLSKWKTLKLETIENMFIACYGFKGKGLKYWDTSKLKDISFAFWGCEEFNEDISDWDISKILFAAYAFKGCEKFNYDLSKWNYLKETGSINGMFDACTTLEKNNLIPAWYKK